MYPTKHDGQSDRMSDKVRYETQHWNRRQKPCSTHMSETGRMSSFSGKRKFVKM